MQRRTFVTGTLGSLALAASGARAAPKASELTSLGASEAIEGMLKGEFTAEAFATALLDQAARLQQELNAFRTLRPDDVKAAAREADRKRATRQKLGRLHGLPIPVKDSVNTSTLPTSQGTRALENFVPRQDAGVLKPLFAQGAILMGKTNLHELSRGWSSNNLTFGPVLNPYDRTRTPGGSSGGSAAAVAARMAPMAIAEDTYGSIRVPAAFCALAGLRPTYRRYPDDGIMPLSRDKFDQVGPLARNVRDLILFDSVVTGARDEVRPASLKGVRIAVSPAYLAEGQDRECARLTSEALDRLKSAGVEIVVAELPEPMREASAVVRGILGFELLDSIADFLREQGTGISLEELAAKAGADLAPRLVRGDPGDPETYRALLRKKEAITAATAEYFRTHEVQALAFAPTMMPAFVQGNPQNVPIDGRSTDILTAIGRNVALGSCASLACLVLPIGLTDAGLPVALEFDAPSGSDRRLLGLGLSLERALGPVRAPAI
jgi:Asp-tRNA(Asn)/Glu-tRNA(Gln) amidotransferase A subunit family amidase